MPKRPEQKKTHDDLRPGTATAHNYWTRIRLGTATVQLCRRPGGDESQK